MFPRIFPGDFAEDAQFGERVRTQAVRAVQTNGGAFADGKQPLDARFAAGIGFDAAHGVVRGRAYRNGVSYRINADKFFGK